MIVDTHTHSPGFLPRYAAGAMRLATRRTRPDDIHFDVAHTAGVDAIVAKAVGDPIGTAWRGPAWRALQHQLADIERETTRANGTMVRTTDDMWTAKDENRLAVLLGIEGADALGTDLQRLEDLARRGLRVMVPVHLGDNAIGTTCLPWQQYLGPIPVRRQAPGLTPFGHELIAAMNDLGVVVDASHADEETLRGMVECSRAPVICSHVGARRVSDFARYLSDDAIRLVAQSGGVVGLWPYHRGKHGTPTVAAVVDHARAVADLVGPKHLCLGTDMNGVPGVADGYRDERDVPVLVDALRGAGFTASEMGGIVGANFLRVLDTTTKQSRGTVPSPR